jgi:hypothetical protein
MIERKNQHPRVDIIYKKELRENDIIPSRIKKEAECARVVDAHAKAR